MNKNIVVLGGGTGQSILLKGLKQFPCNISAVVSVSDDGKSTGKIREEFNLPAVGDLRRVIVSLSETDSIVEKLINYRFETNGDFNGHAVGNILLAALTNISGNLSSGIKEITKLLNLKGKVLPLTDDNVTLVAKMEDDSIIYGEHNITKSPKKIKSVYYESNPHINSDVIKSIKESDAIILSMGSIFTSIIPNLISKSVIRAIDSSKAKIIYVCNIMTQPGETDDFKVSDHINLLNSYLGKKKIDAVIVNNKRIKEDVKKIYETLEQKDLVVLDKENISTHIISKPLIKIENNTIRHDSVKLSLEIMNILMK